MKGLSQILIIIYLIKTILTDKLEESLSIKTVNDKITLSVNFGQPAQSFNMVVSTTESVSWIPSINCENCSKEEYEQSVYKLTEVTDNSGKRFLTGDSLYANNTTSSNITSIEPSLPLYKITKGKYDEIYSATSIDKNQTIEVQSIEGNLIGDRKAEVISIGKSLNGISFNFVAATKINKWSDTYGSEGVLGLSYKNINGDDFGLLNNLKHSGSIDKKVFSIGNGEIFIGNYPTQTRQFPNKFNQCNVTLTEGLIEEYMDSWVCDLSHILLGNSKNFSHSDEIQGRAVFDSAFSYLEVPLKYIELFKEKYFANFFSGKVCNQIEKDNYISFICEQSTKIEEISLIIGGYGLIIPEKKLFKEIQVNNSTMVEFNIVFSKEQRNFWRVGRLLLDEYLVVYDNEEGTVGFFGDNKKNFLKEWLLWWNSGFKSITSQEHFKYLLAACIALGSAILLVIICLVVQAIKSKSNEQAPPLYEEEMREQE